MVYHQLAKWHLTWAYPHLEPQVRESPQIGVSDVVVVTDPPTLTCANSGLAGAGYALGTLAAALHCRFQGSQVPVFELFSRAG